MKKSRGISALISISICLILTGCTKTLVAGSGSKGGRSAAAMIGPLGQNTVKGTFTARETGSGAVTIDVKVEGLSAGKHGAHIHSGATCGDAGKAAGPHWDPNATGKHGDPATSAMMHHAADMPNIEVGASGKGSMHFRTTNFKLDDLIGKTIIVHETRDNYTDSPANGGSGSRIGCGVIQAAK